MPRDGLGVYVAVGGAFAILFVYYLSKAVRDAKRKRLLCRTVRTFSAFPQVQGEVTGIGMHGSTVSFHDVCRELHSAEFAVDPALPAEAGMQVQLRTSLEPIPQLLYPVNAQANAQPFFVTQDQLDSTELVMTEQNWNAVLSALTSQQKTLSRAIAKNVLIASGAGLIDLLIALLLAFLLSR